MFVAYLVPGVEVEGFWSAFLGAILLLHSFEPAQAAWFKSKEKKNVEETATVQEVADTISYRIAEGYELMGGVKELITPKFGSSKAFNQYFKAKDANATEIDFNSEYVIAAIKPDAKGVKLVLDGVNEASNDRVLMTYYTEEAPEGETNNMLLIVVPDSIDGYVDVKEII